MPAFYTKIIELINNATHKNKDKPNYVSCRDYNHIDNMRCFGLHSPFLSSKCLRCISLDRYNWLYIIIDCDYTTEEIDSLRSQGVYIHQSLLDVEAGLMPCELEHHIQDTIDSNSRYRMLVFATRNAETLEALCYYGALKNYYTVFIYKRQVTEDYELLQQLFNSGYGKLIEDINSFKQEK